MSAPARLSAAPPETNHVFVFHMFLTMHFVEFLHCFFILFSFYWISRGMIPNCIFNLIILLFSTVTCQRPSSDGTQLFPCPSFKQNESNLELRGLLLESKDIFVSIAIFEVWISCLILVLSFCGCFFDRVLVRIECLVLDRIECKRIECSHLENRPDWNMRAY